MNFLVTAHDYQDENALERRISVREEHLNGIENMVEKGKILYAVALIDDNEKMIGSVIVADFYSREELDEWLKTEPYVVSKVWEKIEVSQCKIGSIFMNLQN